MRRALELARRARGRTSPNPLVGAVVLSGGRIVGEGFHERAGTPHAEIHALRAAGESTRGATLVVTLEPCNHTGRTPPCTEAIVAAGVSHVVSAMRDPNPGVTGQGHELLRGRGIQVDTGVLEAEATDLNAEYIYRVKTGRTFVALKAATSLDGRLGADGGDSQWITGSLARLRAHALRDRYDAVLIGRGTALRDDPHLDVRLPGARRNPLAAVLDSRLELPLHLALFDRASQGAAVFVFAHHDAAAEREQAVRDRGAEVIRVGVDDQAQLDLDEVLRALADRGCNSVLAEGGEKLHTSLLRRGLASRVHQFVAPCILGGRGGPRLVGDLGISSVAKALRLVRTQVEVWGDDVLMTGDLEANPGDERRSLRPDAATENVLNQEGRDVHRNRS